MSDERYERLMERISALEQRVANMLPVGRVIARDHDKGICIELGTDASPCPSDWFQPGDRTGASRYLPEIGEQLMMVCPGGDWRQATSVPLTHSDAKKNPAKNADETVHHDRDGQRHSVEKGHVKDGADTKHSRWTGGKDAEPTGGSPGSPVHELNKQLQGVKAHLTQHDNQIAGMHDAASKMRAIAQTVIPALASLQPLLNSDPQSLEKAAQGVLGNLEGYVAKSLQGMVGKLTNGFMDNAMDLVNGFMSGQLNGLLGQVAGLGSTGGLDAATQTALNGAVSQAQGMVAGAVGGAMGPLQAQLGTIQGILAGTPAAGAFAALQGQITGAMGDIGKVAAGLGDLVDNQQNLTKGLTKHYRLGGYDGED